MIRRRKQARMWILFSVVLILAIGLVIAIYGKFWTRNINLSYSSAPSVSTSRGEASMLFVGDTMLSRSVGDTMAAKNDYLWPFEKIADFLKEADLTFANLETPISNRGINVGSIYSFRSNPKVIAGLTYAGFDIVSIANNHAWDYGRDAFTDTMDNLSQVGISYIGGGHNESEAHAGVIKKVGDTNVGFLAYTNLLPESLSASGENAGLAILDETQMIKDIKLLKNQTTLVVVSFHWGEEYQTVHNALQERIAHEAIDAGADLIIGHHPHVVEDVGQYKGKYIVYSLGNFIFDQNWSVGTMNGLAVKVWLKNNVIDRIEKIPINISRQYQASL